LKTWDLVAPVLTSGILAEVQVLGLAGLAAGATLHLGAVDQIFRRLPGRELQQDHLVNDGERLPVGEVDLEVPGGEGGGHAVEAELLGEHVVGGLRVRERESMRREWRRVEPALLDQLQQLCGRTRVDEAGGDGDVANPQRLEMERCRVPVHTDVVHTPARPDDRGAELEGFGHSDRLDGDVDSQAFGQLHDAGDRVLATVVDRRVGAELERPSRAVHRRGRSRRCDPA